MATGFSWASDMDDQRTANAIHTIWWQVALGGFLALTAHSVVEAAYARYQLQQLTRQFEADLKAMPSSLLPDAPTSPRERPMPLRQNERCIQGRRFERVQNGWRQINAPC